MSVSPARLHQFHEKLGRRLSKYLPERIRVKARSSESWRYWRASPPGRRLVFDALTEGFIEIAERQRGGSQPVVRLEVDDEGRGLWLGWTEEWCALSGDNWGILGAGWTLYWGYSGVRRKEQLIRAEWDELTRRGLGVGQPHWHFDRELFVSIKRSGAPLESPDSDIEELPPMGIGDSREDQPEELASLDLAGLHLPMGGWTASSEYPNCWQQRIGGGSEGMSRLAEWAERALWCVTGEIDRIKREFA